MSQINTPEFSSCKSGPSLYLLAVFLLAAFSSAILADEARSTTSLRYHLGNIDADLTPLSSLSSADSTGHLAATYLYNITPAFSFGAGYLYGRTDPYIWIWDFDDFEYQAFAVVAEGRIRLSKRRRHSLYGRLSGLVYKYEDQERAFFFNGSTFNSNKTESSGDGTDIGFAVGWSMRFSSGIGIEAGYEYLRLGSDIDIKTANFGLNYSF